MERKKTQPCTNRTSLVLRTFCIAVHWQQKWNCGFHVKTPEYDGICPLRVIKSRDTAKYCCCSVLKVRPSESPALLPHNCCNNPLSKNHLHAQKLLSC